MFGGGGVGDYRDAKALACGTTPGCTDEERGAFAVGVTYWFARFVAAEGSYIRTPQLVVRGSGDTYTFDSSIDAHVVTMAGKGGLPLGPVRIYGYLGTNYHRATVGTTETIEDTTVTVDGAEQTIEGGTQTFELKTAGWGWTFGGGVEAWINPWIGIYGEANRSLLKGDALDDADGRLDEGVTTYLFGARVRIGR